MGWLQRVRRWFHAASIPNPTGPDKITPDEPFPGALERVGSCDGVPLFGEVGAPRPPEVYFVPVGPGCEFQPYIK